MYIPSFNTNYTCLLPNLPARRLTHSQDGGLLCGGRYAEKNCDKWTNGTWTQTHKLRENRAFHVSWTSPSGVFLIGGADTGSYETSELVKKDGSVVEGFALKNKIQYTA